MSRCATNHKKIPWWRDENTLVINVNFPSFLLIEHCKYWRIYYATHATAVDLSLRSTGGVRSAETISRIFPFSTHFDNDVLKFDISVPDLVRFTSSHRLRVEMGFGKLFSSQMTSTTRPTTASFGNLMNTHCCGASTLFFGRSTRIVTASSKLCPGDVWIVFNVFLYTTDLPTSVCTCCCFAGFEIVSTLEYNDDANLLAYFERIPFEFSWMAHWCSSYNLCCKQNIFKQRSQWTSYRSVVDRQPSTVHCECPLEWLKMSLCAVCKSGRWLHWCAAADTWLVQTVLWQ